MSNNRKLTIIAMLILGTLIFFWSLNTALSPILVSNVKAVKMNENMYSVYMNMRNDGEPESIKNIQSTDKINAFIMGAHPTFGITIPQGASPSFSSDGAHIMVNTQGVNYNIGEFIPLTIVFANSGSQQIKAIIEDPVSRTKNTMSMGDESSSMDHSQMDHSMHQAGAAIEVNPDKDTPKIEMKVSQNKNKTWSVRLTTHNFEFFEPKTEPLTHKSGQGHGHLYLNGMKLQRMYSNTATIGELPKGQHLISVTLNSNDHKAYTLNDEPISASSEITAN